VSQRGAVQQDVAGAEEFTAEQLAKVDGIIAKYKGKPGSLIPVLEDIQEGIGFLPKEIQKRVALGLRAADSSERGVRGRHLLPFLHHGAEGSAHHPGVHGNGLLRGRRVPDSGFDGRESEAATGRHQSRPAVHPGDGEVPGVLWPGAGCGDQRGHPSTGEGWQNNQNPSGLRVTEGVHPCQSSK
jgi:hypothetical protein